MGELLSPGGRLLAVKLFLSAMLIYQSFYMTMPKRVIKVFGKGVEVFIVPIRVNKSGKSASILFCGIKFVCQLNLVTLVSQIFL
uniref:Uncharacterized protein n=1 Tax=Arundo donax TaxID=35708 RepID=A0A0A9C8K0_ARUDO